MRTRPLVVITILLALAVPAPAAHAGGVVTVCDEPHLLAALAGGGAVTFTCSGTIILTAEIVISADTTIDGSGETVTISGNYAVRVLRVNSGVTVTIDELTIANGVPPDPGGGGIYNSGSLTLRHSAIVDNFAAYGGGVYNSGELTVDDSTFANNAASLYDGGGIYNHTGTLHVWNSTFSRNGAGQFGAAIANRGLAEVRNSTFTDNNTDYGCGGGIYNGGTATVSNSAFFRNSADYGGGIYGSPQSTLAISHSAFFGNSANDAGGGISADGAATVSASYFSGNWANDGGGIMNNGTLTVSRSTFSSNMAFWPWAGGGINNEGTLDLSNSTLYGNSSSYQGGGIFNGRGATTVSNSTLVSNNAGYQGGNIRNQGGTVTLKNAIVANSAAGGNCSGPIVDGGGNLSYPDTTCPGMNANPVLGPLQDNGGPTLTMAPGPGSAAINAGNDAICAATPVSNFDQRGIVRPQGAHCDIGAVEQYCPSFVPPATVGVEDIVAIATRWGSTNTTPGWDPIYDLNGDNKIDVVDILLVTRVWGGTCS